MLRRLALVVFVAACHRSRTLPADLTGTFVSSGAPKATITAGPAGSAFPGLDLPPIDLSTAMGGPDELTVTSSGISMKSNGALKMPPLKLGPMMAGGATSSDLFTSVDCASSTSCRFKTKSGCEGSIEKDKKGALQIVATDPCSEWAGTWDPRR